MRTVPTAGWRRATPSPMTEIFGAYHLIEASAIEWAAVQGRLLNAARRAGDDPRIRTWSCGKVEDRDAMLVVVSSTDPAALDVDFGARTAGGRFATLPLENPLKGTLATPQPADLPCSTRLHVARLPIKFGQRDRAIDVIASELHDTHAEPGAHRFSIHPEIENHDALIVIEAWRQREDWEAHMVSPYCRAVMNTLPQFLDGDMEVHIAEMFISAGAGKSI